MAVKMTQFSTNPFAVHKLTKPKTGIARATFRYAPLALVAVLAVSGCQRTSGLYQSDPLPTRQDTTSLEPAPLTPVQQGELDPITSTDQPDTPTKPGEDGSVTVAAAEPPADAQPVTRQAMVGAWTVSTGGASCQIFLALTKWSGGYRAASRGCSAPAISDVQAWDVKDKQVVLVNSTGNTAATLYRSSEQRYDGSTNGGGAISFTR